VCVCVFWVGLGGVVCVLGRFRCVCVCWVGLGVVCVCWVGLDVCLCVG